MILKQIIIGVLWKKLYQDNKIYIITGFHDYLQLLYNDNVQIYTMKMKSFEKNLQEIEILI